MYYLCPKKDASLGFHTKTKEQVKLQIYPYNSVMLVIVRSLAPTK
jgi:hypothetical protein